MTNPLRVGVIGLGPRWRRHYRPALRRLRAHFEVSAVCDQVHARATHVAKGLGCAAAGGVADLLERKDVEALLLLDPQWHGLWAVERACQAGMPVFCCPHEGISGDEVEAVRRQAEAGGVPVLLALPLRVLPVAARLHALLTDRLGAPRVALASAAVVGAGLSLFDLADWCGTLFGAAPVRVTPTVTPSLSSLALEYEGGRAAQLTTYRAPGAAGPVRLEVIAERGRAVVQGPDRLAWTDADGRHTDRPRGQSSAARTLLEQFRQVAAGQEAPNPALEEVVRLLKFFAPTPATATPGA